ncbi:hypothetical protein MASR1M12_02470 [Erysipelotrichia bacterium]
MPDNSETQILEFKESWRDEYLPAQFVLFCKLNRRKLVIGKDDNGNLLV